VKELGLELDAEKTLINELQNRVSFLGFKIIRWKKKQIKVSKKLQKRNNKNNRRKQNMPYILS